MPRNNAFGHTIRPPEDYGFCDAVYRAWDAKSTDYSNPPSTVLTKDGSNRMSNLVDQSPFGLDLEQTIGSNQPLWVDNQLNGKPIIRFDRTNAENLESNNKEGNWIREQRYSSNHRYGWDIFWVAKYASDVQGAINAGQDQHLFSQSLRVANYNRSGCRIEFTAGGNETFAITAVDTVNDTITVAGDRTLTFLVGTVFWINGSTGNDARYTVVSSTYTTSTVIEVAEDITDATADGNAVGNPPAFGGGSSYALDLGAGVTDKQIISLAWQSGNTVRATFESSFDDTLLTGTGEILFIENAVNDIWNGDFLVTAKGTDYVDFTHPTVSDATNDVTSAYPAIGTVGDETTTNIFTTTGDFEVVLDSQWHVYHIHFSFDPDGDLNKIMGYLYYDDIPVHLDLATNNTAVKWIPRGNAGEVYLGVRNGTTQPFDGDLAELITTNRPLTCMEIGLVRNWLYNAYGVA